eukprot:jgi/Chrzof1/4994/Cz15g07230.t1
MCQFGINCSRPVCFFAHGQGQVRYTGIPGGAQPVVAPPDTLTNVSADVLAADQLLLASLGDVNMQQQLQAAGLSTAQLSRHSQDSLIGGTNVINQPLMNSSHPHALDSWSLAPDSYGVLPPQTTTAYVVRPTAASLRPQQLDTHVSGISHAAILQSNAFVQDMMQPNRLTTTVGTLNMCQPNEGPLLGINALLAQQQQQPNCHQDLQQQLGGIKQNDHTLLTAGSGESDDPETLALLAALVKRLAITRQGSGQSVGTPTNVESPTALKALNLPHKATVTHKSTLMDPNLQALTKSWSSPSSPNAPVNDVSDPSRPRLEDIAPHSISFSHTNYQPVSMAPVKGPSMLARASSATNDDIAPAIVLDNDQISANKLRDMFASSLEVGLGKYDATATVVNFMDQHGRTPIMQHGAMHNNVMQLMDAVAVRQGCHA